MDAMAINIIFYSPLLCCCQDLEFRISILAVSGVLAIQFLHPVDGAYQLYI